MSATYRLDELGRRYGLDWRGNPARLIAGVGSLEQAGPDQLSFLANSQLSSLLARTRAGVVVLHADSADARIGDCLISDNPHASFARIAALFEQRPAARPGIDPTAVVGPGASIHPDASIGPFCHVADDARIDAGVELGPHCVIGPRCHIGAQSRLVARVTLVQDVSLGQRVLLHPGAVIGADGFGLAFDRDAWLKVPQLGGVRIGDDCEIGANTTIDRGALEDTVLEQDVRLDNLVQIAHNVRIGAHTVMAGCSAVAGSARIGSYCLIGGKVGIAGHLDICDKVTITAMSMVSHAIREPGEYSSGIPVQERRRWQRTIARLRRLDRPGRPSGTDTRTTIDE